MPNYHKKFFLTLIILVILTSLLFINQIRRAGSIVIEKNTEPLVSDETYDIPLDPADPALGNPGAPLTLVEFGDFTSARGREVHDVLIAYVREHPQNARLVWKNFPEPSIFSRTDALIHPAALCAGEQKKFWPYADAIATRRATADAATLNTIAASLQLDVPRWTNCATGDAVKQRIADDIALAKTLGVRSSPGLFINNKRINLTKDVDLGQLLQTLTAK